MDEQAQQNQVPEAPRGMYPSRLDDKGRLKLPVAFQQYFGSLAEKKLFVTSLDRRTAQIYTIAAWRENEKFFDSYFDDPVLVETVAFIANDLGAEAEMDGQGRVTFPPELRRELEIENQPVRIFSYKGHIEVLSEKLYEEKKQGAGQLTAEGRTKLQKAGLK